MKISFLQRKLFWSLWKCSNSQIRLTFSLTFPAAPERKILDERKELPPLLWGEKWISKWISNRLIWSKMCLTHFSSNLSDDETIWQRMDFMKYRSTLVVSWKSVFKIMKYKMPNKETYKILKGNENSEHAGHWGHISIMNISFQILNKNVF